MPPTFSYTSVAAFVIDDFWGFVVETALKNNLRYATEDILGDPAAASHRIFFTHGKVRIGTSASIEGDGTNPLTLDSEDKGIKFGSEGHRIKKSGTDQISLYADDGTTELIRFYLPISGSPGYTRILGSDLGSSGTPVANSLYRDNIVKAWAYVDGSATPSILADFNLASVSRASAGVYDYTFSTAMANANYAVFLSPVNNIPIGGQFTLAYAAKLTTGFTSRYYTGGGPTYQDNDLDLLVLGRA